MSKSSPLAPREVGTDLKAALIDVLNAVSGEDVMPEKFRLIAIEKEKRPQPDDGIFAPIRLNGLVCQSDFRLGRALDPLPPASRNALKKEALEKLRYVLKKDPNHTYAAMILISHSDEADTPAIEMAEAVATVSPGAYSLNLVRARQARKPEAFATLENEEFSSVRPISMLARAHTLGRSANGAWEATARWVASPARPIDHQVVKFTHHEIRILVKNEGMPAANVSATDLMAVIEKRSAEVGNVLDSAARMAVDLTIPQASMFESKIG